MADRRRARAPPAPRSRDTVDRHNYHLFQPLLYQVATAALSPGDVASPIRWVLRHQQNVTVLLGEAERIDYANRRVVLNVGTLDYDYLIVAAGSAHAYFGHPEWASRAGLKTGRAREFGGRCSGVRPPSARTDAAAQARLPPWIVGGGPTGVELAGALAEIAQQALRKDFRNIHPESARIVLVEGGPDVLGTFPEPLRRAARRSLTRLGVDVRTGSVVTSVDRDGVRWRLAADRSAPEEALAAQTVLWAAGIAASPLAQSLDVPLDRNGRIPIVPTLEVPSRPGVFAVGDICTLEQDGRLLPGVAQVAQQQGAHAARNIVQAIRGEPLTPFRYHDYGNMATIGRGSAVADFGRVKASGFPAWLIWLFVHIFWLIGFRNRLVVLGEWAWSYFTLQRRVRLITGERLRPGP